MNAPTQPPAWHQSLVYVLTGRRHPELGRQEQPDLAVLAAFLRDGRAEEATVFGRPHRLPPDLAEGIGAAQLWAAVSALRALLSPARDRDTQSPAPVLSNRSLSADEQRLLREVPPHHGS